MKTKMNFSIISMALISIISISSVSAQEYDCPMGGYGGMMTGSYGAGGLFFGWVTSILIIALIIAAIYWLIKSAQGKK